MFSVCDKTYSNTDGVIHSPMYESKAEYPPKTQCTYKILAQDDKHVINWDIKHNFTTLGYLISFLRLMRLFEVQLI